MLREVEKTRQIPDEPLRRWFAGRECDILVWMTGEGMLWGFEFRYPRAGAVEADALLRWDCEGSVVHHLIDFGSGAGNGFKVTPLYGPEVPCDLDRVLGVYESELDAGADAVLMDIAAILRETKRRGMVFE